MYVVNTHLVRSSDDVASRTRYRYELGLEQQFSDNEIGRVCHGRGWPY